MAPRILILILAGFITTSLNGVCAAADTLQCTGRITSLECSFVRTQSFQGQSRVAQGRFFYDRETRSACYDYRGAYLYRFVVNDTAVFGIDKKNNRGYTLVRSDNPQRYDDLRFSIHLFGQFLRGVAETTEKAGAVVRASLDTSVYLEQETPGGRDIVAVTRETGRPTVIESFDTTGAMVEQSKMTYKKQTDGVALPVRLVVRKKSGDVVTLDILAISSGAINKPVAPESFGVPKTCRMVAFGETETGTLLTGEKRK
jgi:outer membrane lipoprotein-sorting protein